MHTIDVSVFNVFKVIGVYPIIILGCKNYQGAFARFELSHYENLTQRIFTTRETLQPFSLFEQLGIKINSGATGFQAQQLKLAIFNVQDDKSIPFAVSGNIDRYTWSNQSVRYMDERYFQAYISNKNSVLADSKWKFWQNPKIVIAGMTKVIEAVYVESALGIGVGCYGIYDFGNYYPYCLTAVLNSKYMTNYFVTKFKDKHLAGGYLAINKSTKEGLPLVAISKATQEILCILSKDIHNKTRDNENTTQLQRKIDVIVFKLFNISFSEAKEICPNYSIDEHEYYKLNII